LAEMAARYGVAVAVLWRLEKGGRAAQTRALDALSASAPVVWLLANDPYRRQGRLAICTQNRLGPPPENMAFGAGVAASAGSTRTPSPCAATAEPCRPLRRAVKNEAATSVAASWSAVIHHRFRWRLQPPFAASRVSLARQPPLPLSVLVEKQRSLRDGGKRR
ncbi:MAG TPA: hypothetical protein VF278_04170, partial [Pirellulales bacterium]